ncbi:hypothetical protein Aperf_G00000057211 [Anoplocephala perfoliata]
MSVRDVSRSFHRFTQRASELVNMGGKTSYPQHTNELINHINQMNPWLKRIITSTEDYFDINKKNNTTDRFGVALEAVAEQSEKAAPTLTTTMREAAAVHSRMTEAKKAFNNEVNRAFIENLKQFQATTLAEALKAKTNLEHSRLDLDSGKSRLKSAKTPEIKSKCEAEVEKEAAEFDRIHQESVEIFEKTCQEFDNLHIQLLDLIRAENKYHSDCAQECQHMLKE